MLETMGWIACLIMAMMALYQYLKAEHAQLLEHRLVTVSGDGLSRTSKKRCWKYSGRYNAGPPRKNRLSVRPGSRTGSDSR